MRETSTSHALTPLTVGLLGCRPGPLTPWDACTALIPRAYLSTSAQPMMAFLGVVLNSGYTSESPSTPTPKVFDLQEKMLQISKILKSGFENLVCSRE